MTGMLRTRRVGEFIPILSMFRTYPRQWLGSDLLAGLSVCVVMIPSVIAYAELAGLWGC